MRAVIFCVARPPSESYIGVETGIGEIFDDISGLEKNCKFGDCTHTQEMGCVILEALDEGSISQERFQSYKKMLKESRHYEMSYLEKKKKSKKLGKIYKSVQKDNRKN